MARSEIEWPYANMSVSRMAGVDGTEGVFRLTTKAEWKIVPNERGRRTDHVLNPYKMLLGRPPQLGHDSVFSLMGSVHRYKFEIRNAGASSCHVKMIDSVDATQHADFDLLTTSEDEFISALERIGEATVEHPYFGNERSTYQENVSLDGVTTKVSFDRN
jgi:hypothetical protein